MLSETKIMRGDEAPRAPNAAESGDWRTRIAANLGRASAQRLRALFAEINPHLVGDALFEERWSDIRRDAAVLVPIIGRAGGPTVLLTVRSSDMPSHAGQISFPGGKVQPEDGGPVAAALREAHEEVNIRPQEVDVIGALGVHQGGLGFSVTPVLGVVAPSADIRACPRDGRGGLRGSARLLRRSCEPSHRRARAQGRQVQHVCSALWSLPHLGPHRRHPADAC
ncbi:MAG: CoA pyrophosphatase [Rhodomicrobium sp.]|nr:CoA pyrophosphatase [Rhodomicrobium sp.]